jgi:4-oxalocrotonate tautomerase
MPVTRIAIREGKTPEYKQALMDEIYEAMRETVSIKDGDRFMAISEHGEHEFAYGPFLGIDRDDDLVQIQVFWAPGKTVDAKLAMYKKDRRAARKQPGGPTRGSADLGGGDSCRELVIRQRRDAVLQACSDVVLINRPVP